MTSRTNDHLKRDNRYVRKKNDNTSKQEAVCAGARVLHAHGAYLTFPGF